MNTPHTASSHTLLAISAGAALVGAVAGIALSNVIPMERALLIWLGTALLVGLMARPPSGGAEFVWWKAPLLALAPSLSLAAMLGVVVLFYKDGVISGNLVVTEFPGGLKLVLIVIAVGTWIACTLAIWARPVVVKFFQGALGIPDSTMTKISAILVWAIAVLGMVYTISTTIVSGPQSTDSGAKSIPEKTQ